MNALRAIRVRIWREGIVNFFSQVTIATTIAFFSGANDYI
jgi:hypothetical protein